MKNKPKMIGLRFILLHNRLNSTINFSIFISFSHSHSFEIGVFARFGWLWMQPILFLPLFSANQNNAHHIHPYTDICTHRYTYTDTRADGRTDEEIESEAIESKVIMVYSLLFIDACLLCVWNLFFFPFVALLFHSSIDYSIW